jgi:hypothetical protein
MFPQRPRGRFFNTGRVVKCDLGSSRTSQNPFRWRPIFGYPSRSFNTLLSPGRRRSAADRRNQHSQSGRYEPKPPGDRSATIIGQSVDFARSSVARAPDRFRE